MPIEPAATDAHHLLADMMEAIEAAADRREVFADPGAGVAVHLGGLLHADHLMLARERAWATLAPLPLERRIALVDALLHATVGGTISHERTLRQMLGNRGVRLPLPVAEPPGPPTAALIGLRALDAALAERAQAALDAWQAASTAAEPEAEGFTGGAAAPIASGGSAEGGAGGRENDASQTSPPVGTAARAENASSASIASTTSNASSVISASNASSAPGACTASSTSNAPSANDMAAASAPDNALHEHPGQRSIAAATAALAWAERTAWVSFGVHDPRSVRATVASLQACGAARNGVGAYQRVGFLVAARANLDAAQLGVVAGLWPLLRGEVVGEWDHELRQRKAADLATQQAYLHDQAQRRSAGRSLAHAFAQGARVASRLSRGEPDSEDDADGALESQLARALDNLADAGPAAQELSRRAIAKLEEWRQATGDGRGTCGAWLTRWLTVVTGYPFGTWPQPSPPYDRSATRTPYLVPDAEVQRRRCAFRAAFAEHIVGNVSAYGQLDNYLRDALAYGRPALVLLHGAPGTGKGEITKLVAEHLFPDFAFFSRNVGAADGADRVRGVAPNFHGAELSLFGEGLAARRGRQIFFFVDEVDHTSVKAQEALATALDFDDRLPFRDGCLDVPLSLQGDVIFCAGNDIDTLLPHLRSRFERGLVLRTEDLTPSSRRRLLRKKLLAELQVGGYFPYLTDDMVMASDAALDALQDGSGGANGQLGMREALGALTRLGSSVRYGSKAGWKLILQPFHVALSQQRNFLGFRSHLPQRRDASDGALLSFFCHDVADSTWRTEIFAALRCEHGDDAAVCLQVDRCGANWIPCGDHALEPTAVQVRMPGWNFDHTLKPVAGHPFAQRFAFSLRRPKREYWNNWVDPDVALHPNQCRVEAHFEVACRGPRGKRR